MMPDQLTPAEKFQILAGILSHVRQRLHEISDESLASVAMRFAPVDLQFVRESIADACHAIDAAVADVPTEEEIASNA